MTIRALGCLLALLFLILPVAEPASAQERRVALVIGNAAYKHTKPLRNPVNDADDMAQALKKLGFDVVFGTNLTIDDMDQLREEFEKRAKGADVALFYYAGHGLQFEGRNYLVPIDARLEREARIRRELTSIDELIADMQRTAKLGLVFLDACRNNPLTDKLANLTRNGAPAAGRGLARIDAGKDANTLVVYATTPGDTAEDGVGRNSPFTESLLRHIEAPDDVEVMLKKVVRDVSAATRGRQQPERLSKLRSDFHFVRRDMAIASQKAPPPLTRPPSGVSRGEMQFWDQCCKASDDPEMFKAYLNQYPGGVFANAARQRINDLTRKQAKASEPDPEFECNEAMRDGGRDAFKKFLDRFPSHRCSDQIRRTMRMDADEESWKRAEKSASIAGYKRYLEMFPDGVYGTPAKDRIASLEAVDRGKFAPPSVTRAPTPDLPPQLPPKYVSPAPAPSVSFQRYTNRWVDGEGYRIIPGGTYDDCARVCRADEECKMFEYYFGSEGGGRRCNLFSHTRIERDRSDTAHVGIKQQ